MAKYIERDAFIAWLKKIPMVDLSDGRGLCRVIFEDDFKRAIKNMPENIIHGSEVFVRCEKCVLHGNCITEDTFVLAGIENPFCCAGKRKEGAD